MKERYTRAELRRRFDAVYYLPGKYCQLRGVLGEGSGYMDRVEGWACDVYDDAEAVDSAVRLVVGRHAPLRRQVREPAKRVRKRDCPVGRRFGSQG